MYPNIIKVCGLELNQLQITAKGASNVFTSSYFLLSAMKIATAKGLLLQNGSQNKTQGEEPKQQTTSSWLVKISVYFYNLLRFGGNFLLQQSWLINERNEWKRKEWRQRGNDRERNKDNEYPLKNPEGKKKLSTLRKFGREENYCFERVENWVC